MDDGKSRNTPFPFVSFVSLWLLMKVPEVDAEKRRVGR